MKRVPHILLVFILSLTVWTTYAHGNDVKELHECCSKAGTDSAKADALQKLAAYYYAIREDRIGDSIINKQLACAEQCNNKDIMLRALFNNPRLQLLGSISRTSKNIVTNEAAGITLSYINKAMDYARMLGANDYIALANKYLSHFYLVQGNFEEAAKYANIAYTSALNTKNDSLKVVCGLQIGYTYMHKREVLMAFKHYTTALELAEDKNSTALTSNVYHYLSDMYKKLGDDEQAKGYILKSIELNKQSNVREGLVDDYISMGKLSDNIAEEYFNQALTLSDSLGDMFGKVQAERFIFTTKMFSGKPVELVQYLNSRKELYNIFVRTGPHFLDCELAEVYLYGGMYDSAYYHFQEAYADFNSLYVTELKQGFMNEFADCCAKLGKNIEAINAHQIALNFTSSTSNIIIRLSSLYSLRALYEKSGDYKHAYDYSIQYEAVKDSINKMANDREIALKEIDVLEKQKQREEELQKNAEERRHNLQYMAITVSIASVFILLIFLGMFRVSQNSIRILSFFAFIFFFEFIILLLDHRIHNMVHGEPLKIWLVKIVLLSILLPLHHRMEEWLTHYLVSRKLVAVRERASLRAWLQKLFSNRNETKK